VRMMGPPGRVGCEHFQWVHLIWSITCMAIYNAQPLRRTPQRVRGRDAPGGSSFRFLTRR